MKTANIILRLEKHGNDIPKNGVTPAEVAILVSEHRGNAGGDPIVSSTDAAEVTRTDADEIARLRGKYGRLKVDVMFPGGKPNLPVDMKEAKEMGLRTNLPVNKLLIKK